MLRAVCARSSRRRIDEGISFLESPELISPSASPVSCTRCGLNAHDARKGVTAWPSSSRSTAARQYEQMGVKLKRRLSETETRRHCTSTAISSTPICQRCCSAFLREFYSQTVLIRRTDCPVTNCSIWPDDWTWHTKQHMSLQRFAPRRSHA